jgi:hypothetical protein
VKDDSISGDFIRSFFEAPENKHLFSQRPFRSSLARLYEFDAANAGHILAHMLSHFLDHYAGRASETHSNSDVGGISQDDLNEELRYVYNDCNNAMLNDARRLNPDLQPHDDPEYQGFGPEQRDVTAPMHGQN